MCIQVRTMEEKDIGACAEILQKNGFGVSEHVIFMYKEV